MRAGKLFKDLGFTRIRRVTDLIYQYKGDDTEYTVDFDLINKIYFVSCSNYFYTYVDIDMKLHMAIHQQLRELNWIMD